MADDSVLKVGDAIIYGFHNIKGVVDTGADVDKAGVDTGLKNLYPVLCTPMAKIVGDVLDAMEAAYPQKRNADDAAYRVFMQLGQTVAWITLKSDDTVKCTKEGCKRKSPTCYVMRGNFGNPCVGCGERIPGADVVASVLYAYVVHATGAGGDPASVVSPVTFNGSKPSLLNIGATECEPDEDGFLAAPEKAAIFSGMTVLLNIVAFMPWLSTIGHIAAKPDLLPIYGVEEGKLVAYGKEIAKKIKPGDDVGTAWKSDNEGEGGDYYGLMMVRMTSKTLPS